MTYRFRARPIIWMAVLLLSVGLAGCGTVQNKNRAMAMDDSLKTYEKLIRWGEFRAAANYIVFREKEPKPFDFEFLEHVRVTAYQVTDRIISPDELEITIRASLEYYHDESNRVFSLRDVQIWWYDEELKRWFLDSELPDFRRGMRAAR